MNDTISSKYSPNGKKCDSTRSQLLFYDAIGKSHDYLIMLLTFVFYKTVRCRSNEDCGSDACDTVSGRCEYFPRLVKLYITISYFDDLDKNNFISTLLLLLLQYDGMSLFKIFLLC